jgi:hypothetical protein
VTASAAKRSSRHSAAATAYLSVRFLLRYVETRTGGDRLSRVDVVFEVASQPYPLDEQAATLMAENLRVKAAHEPGAEGTAGARAVADAIELRLTEDTLEPISLGGEGAEAVFYALNAPTGGSDRPWALYDAVKRLHDERLRPKS